MPVSSHCNYGELTNRTAPRFYRTQSVPTPPVESKATHLFRMLSVLVKYAERHSSHARRPASFVLRFSAWVRSYTACQPPRYARLPMLWKTNGSVCSLSRTTLFSLFVRYFAFWFATGGIEGLVELRTKHEVDGKDSTLGGGGERLAINHGTVTDGVVMWVRLACLLHDDLTVRVCE